MSFTLYTSHFETSSINAVARAKRRVMVLMLDTSHSPISPCGPLRQSPFGNNSRHVSTARLSSGLECGENAGWDGVVRSGLGQGETVGLCSEFWHSYNESTSRFTLYEAGFGFRRDQRCVFVHAPPLQQFGDMLTRSTRNRIQNRDGKKICACCCIAFVVCV